MKNPNCDNDKCVNATGQVRVLPIGGGGNLIVCQACFNHEMNYRKEVNQKHKISNEFDIVVWNDLKIYA